MCGRYRRTTAEEELARLYHIPIPKQTDLPISYNIAPSQKVLTIRFNPQTQQRSLDALQWGLILHWAKDLKMAYRTINAPAETVGKAPSFRQAFAKRRCLIPADGFYEWRKTAKPKLPFAIAMKDGRPFTFAGLWENWKDPESGEWLRTCTIITGEPNELVAQIHPRMPVILPEQHHAAWLGRRRTSNHPEISCEILKETRRSRTRDQGVVQEVPTNFATLRKAPRVDSMVRKGLHESEIFSLLYRVGLCAIGAAIIIAVAVVVWLVSFYPGLTGFPRADRISAT